MENNNRQGCRWTKASERLPEVIDSGEIGGIGSDTVHLKLKGIPCAGRYIEDWGMTKKCFVIAGFGWYAIPHFNEIEWLDESSPNQLQQEIEEAEETAKSFRGYSLLRISELEKQLSDKDKEIEKYKTALGNLYVSIVDKDFYNSHATSLKEAKELLTEFLLNNNL